MHLATAAEPGVLMRKLLGRHELAETVVDHNFVILQCAKLSGGHLFAGENLLVTLESD